MLEKRVNNLTDFDVKIYKIVMKNFTESGKTLPNYSEVRIQHCKFERL